METKTTKTTGSDIYNIGHKFSNKGSSRVSILDCRSHTWREAPSMTVERSNPAVNVVDGKIYVAGGCRDDTKWMEVFDPKTQAWEVVSRPGGGGENWGIHVSKSAAFDKKVYMFGNRNDSLAYKPKEGTLENVGWNVELNWRWHSNCVIENVLYSFHQGKFLWYDSKVMVWRRVNGVEYSTKSFRVCMADYGGKMAVFSAMPPDGNRMKANWCAVIALERRTKKNIWGKVEWHDAVLTVSDSCILEYALSATV